MTDHPESSVPMIDVRGVSKWYGSQQVLADCTTSVAPGEVVVICGPSGSGKSTLIKRINGFEPIDKGEIMLFDEPTSAFDPEMIAEVLDVMVGPCAPGMTMMVVAHEMDFARKGAHRVVFMHKGEIVEDTSKDAFFATPRSARAQTFLSKILSH